MSARRSSACADETRILPRPDQGSQRMRQRPSVRPSDIVTAARALLEREREAARGRMSQGGKVRKVSGPSDARDVVGRMFGISGRQVEKMIEVADAAEADPIGFGDLLEEMDRTGAVNGPHTKMKRRQDELRVMSLVPREARVRTLVMDPPWEDEDVSEAQGHTYALMSEAEIAALPVEAWTDENSHLYLWVPNNRIPTGVRLMAGWGFSYKTILTWAKEEIGLGRYFRNASEHILFGVRGQLPTREAGRSTRTVHAWPRPKGPESTKPPASYDLVRACSYPPFGYAFQRQAPADFLNMFVDTRQEAAE